MSAKREKPQKLHFNDRAYTPKQAGQRMLQYVSRDLSDFIEAARMVSCAVIKRDAGKWSDQDMKDFLNAKNADGWTALTFGVVKKQRGFVEKMLSAGADARVKDGYGTSLECYASSAKDETIREWIVTAIREQNRKERVERIQARLAARAEDRRIEKERTEQWIKNGCPVSESTQTPPLPVLKKRPFSQGAG